MRKVIRPLRRLEREANLGFRLRYPQAVHVMVKGQWSSYGSKNDRLYEENQKRSEETKKEVYVQR